MQKKKWRQQIAFCINKDKGSKVEVSNVVEIKIDHLNRKCLVVSHIEEIK